MDTDQYGIYSVYLTWCEIFTIIGTFGFESCAYMSVLTKFEGKDRDEAEASLLELSFLLTTVLLIVFTFFGKAISTLVGLPQNTINAYVHSNIFCPCG